jgi:hypothetical protein
MGYLEPYRAGGIAAVVRRVGLRPLAAGALAGATLGAVGLERWRRGRRAEERREIAPRQPDAVVTMRVVETIVTWRSE